MSHTGEDWLRIQGCDGDLNVALSEVVGVACAKAQGLRRVSYEFFKPPFSNLGFDRLRDY
ncbi:hypothetical protein [Moorena producens]|uniref:hypothetical protein n=1 Tax=Moorena producens TaxID=1155739 RepID=UPI001E391187|nr:hypothetical protein [Moorena producens]